LLYYSSLPAHALKKPIKLMRAALPCVFPSFFKTLLMLVDHVDEKKNNAHALWTIMNLMLWRKNSNNLNHFISPIPLVGSKTFVTRCKISALYNL
jgi:hypothetical protein